MLTICSYFDNHELDSIDAGGLQCQFNHVCYYLPLQLGFERFQYISLSLS